ncbi:MAG: hypothetical protein ACFE0Q_08285 [Anaerolineae bacterium]
MLKQIKTDTHVVVTFDGNVIEFFQVNGGSTRIHIWSITAIEIKLDRRDRHVLVVTHTPAGREHGSRIAESDLVAVQDFVATVQQALPRD